MSWIKMRTDLWECPQVVRIVSALCPHDVRNVSATCPQRAAVIGGLYRLWSLGDQYTEDGKLPGYTAALVDDTVGIEGFAAALCSVEWLSEDAEGVTIAQFTKHNGQSAKRRTQDAQRKQNSRAETVRKPSAKRPHTKRTKSGLDKRRKEKNSNIPVVYTSDFNDAWRHFPKKADKAKAFKAYTDLSDAGALPDHCELVEKIKAYAVSVEGTESKHIKYPSGWLTGRRWEDELSEDTIKLIEVM